MSASPIARQVTQSQVIPSRRMLVTDPSQLPDVYSSTPGGTLYSTTPGGTRIVYERAFMMNLRNSPISKTPPRCSLPAGLMRGAPSSPPSALSAPAVAHAPVIEDPHLDEQFDMEL
ncbi:eukaryotic translation initiation factor 4E binding protein thor [Arctopsyche grandis]|uniref:eukaryotic translation initiation factor 4E binding protein thor n=1 Tax=Arctopsyche grandis TaxID=121162 RepID=UPI00406D8DD1